MGYERPVNSKTLSKEQKLALLRDYVAHYEIEAARDESVLNRKVPRDAFASLLDRIGELLVNESRRLSLEAGPVHSFLEETPLPAKMEKLLPPDFRVFCLALNALKQWVAAEQSATDRYLLGRKARELCRSATVKCIITDETLGADAELHHPVRDGRPPFLLSAKGHKTIEGQLSGGCEDPVEASLIALRLEGNRSWAMLRRGCRDLLSEHAPSTSSASARTFARKAKQVSNLSYSQLLSWLDKKVIRRQVSFVGGAKCAKRLASAVRRRHSPRMTTSPVQPLSAA